MREREIKEAESRLKDHIRRFGRGGCRILSQGGRCTCLLCDVDLLVHEAARIAELEQANAELRAQLTALARYFDGFNVADFEAAREAVREFTNTGGGA